MAMLGLTPQRLLDNLVGMFEALWNMGFEAFGTLGMWLVYGAMIVIPRSGSWCGSSPLIRGR